ncbi:TPA: SIR2 family protein [Streptococcus suis]|nr:SIR2 family protein [Streptococcus suis]
MDSSYKRLVTDLSEAIKQQKLVIFVGAGVSISQGYPNWNEYVGHLIKYWQGQVLAESKNKNIGIEQIKIFDLISKLDVSNKRKVELVNQELKIIFKNDFENRRLDFEKAYFKHLLPFSTINPTLQHLASLNAILITSNYDYEIENHFKLLKNTVKTINDLNEFQQSRKGKLVPGDILHIHGTPDCDVKYFVSSSADYSRTYLKNKKNYKDLVNWFQNTRPIVLFIGASLEEDEILSLLHEGSKNYALMKEEKSSSSKVDEHYKTIVENFFNSENHTQIIWFGDKFDDLPVFTERLVADINKELGIHELHIEWKKLLNPSVAQETYNKSLDSISSDSNYLSSLINRVIEIDNPQLNSLLLGGVLQGETIKQIKSGSFPLFWKFISKNFVELDNHDWEKIYSIIIQGNQNCYMDDMYIVYNRAIEKAIFNNEKLNELREVISEDSDVINSSFNQDSTLLGYWLVNTFERNDDYLYIEDDSELEVNLNPINIEKMVNAIKDSQKYRYYSFEHLQKENDNIELFYQLVKTNRLFLDGESFIVKVPDELLDTRLVQKLLVQFDNETGLNQTLVNKLIEYIDFSDTHFGEELNTFVNKHKGIIDKEIPEKPYRNMIFSMEGGWVSQYSFLTIEDLVEYDEAELLDILENSEDEQKRSSFLEEETIRETENFLISVLKNSSELSEKVSNLLKNHSKKLFSKFKRLYAEIIISSEVSEELKNFVKEKYLEKFDIVSFDDNDEKFFKYFITQQDAEQSIFEKLLTVDPNKLSTLRDDNKLLDIFHFINSELGSYLQCLISLIINHSEYSPQVVLKVNEIKDPNYKEIVQGALISEYDDTTKIKITYHTFLGYSYYHTSVTSEAARIFTDVIRQLLNKTIEDNQILDRVFMIALECINPIDEAFDLSQNNYAIMINIVFRDEYEFKYSKQWLQELFKRDSKVNYLETISDLFYRENVSHRRLFSFIEELKNLISNYKFKLRSYSVNNLLNKESVKDNSLLRDFLLLLLEHDLLENDYYYLDTIKHIIKLLSIEERNNILQIVQRQKNCTPPEIEEIQNLINDLSLK